MIPSTQSSKADQTNVMLGVRAAGTLGWGEDRGDFALAAFHFMTWVVISQMSWMHVLIPSIMC